MVQTERIQVARLLYRVLRSDNMSAADWDISEEKAEDILSFCSVNLLELCMQQLIREEDYERCGLLRDLISEKCRLIYKDAWETC